MTECDFCTTMPAEGYVCAACGRTGGNTNPPYLTYQWYMVLVRISGTEPAVLYRHGPRKGEKKSGGWSRVLYDSPTHYYHADVQGIPDEKSCVALVEESYKNMVEALEAQGYTDISVSVTATGFHLV